MQKTEAICSLDLKKLGGIPAEVIMMWTGHSDFYAMKPYIEIVDKLKANEMQKFNKD